MKIVIFTAGSRGDVQPYIALGKGLRDAGCSVRMFSTEDFETLIKGAGLEFWSAGESVQAILQSEAWRHKLDNGNFLTIQAGMYQELKRRASALAPEMVAAAQDADLILGGFGGLGGGFAIAEKLGIPVLQAHLFPFTPTGEFPSPITSGLRLNPRLNRLAFHLGGQILWQSLRPSDTAVRAHLGMRPTSFWGPVTTLERQRVPTLYGYSAHVLPRPADWAAHHHITGYWFLDDEPGWQPPADLLDFLEAGEPPVYLGFGSMRSGDPAQTTRLIIEALAQAGQRGVIASGWGGLSHIDLPDSVYMLSSAPHSWLFPRMGVVVHHGGAGTTAAGLRAGVPSIIVPFMGDQPFWGRRVFDLGVGPAHIPRRRLTSDRLADAIMQAVSSREMRARAADLGQKIRSEDGIGRAVALIQGQSARVIV